MFLLSKLWVRLGNVFTDRLLRVKARRAPSPPHAWLCPYPHSVFSCRPSHCTTPQIYGCLGPPTSEGRLGVRTEVKETIRQGDMEQAAICILTNKQHFSRRLNSLTQTKTENRNDRCLLVWLSSLFASENRDTLHTNMLNGRLHKILLPTWHLDVGPGGIWVLLFLDLIHQHVGISGAVVAFTALWLSCLGLHCLS